MEISPADTSRLPFKKLFLDYLSDFDALSDFYEVNPHDHDGVAEYLASYKFQGDRDAVADLLEEFNSDFEASEQLISNIQRLRADDAVTITTGQQLNLFGGPLMIVFKTLTAIYQAKKLEKATGRPVVPIFWLADEDHDYEEICEFFLLTRDSYTKERYSSPTDAPVPVSEITFDERIDECKEAVRDDLFDTDFSDKLWSILDACYKPGCNFRRAFANIIASLFAEQGIVLAGSHHRGIKQHLKEELKIAVNRHEQIHKALNSASRSIKQAYHQQVELHASNLFYLDPEQGRLKIKLQDGIWSAGEDYHWQTDELVAQLDQHPERFSPNVFLRPILQDKLLPNIGYVGGPGEVSYFGQMKELYPIFDRKMPVIFPRFTGTIVESPIQRILEKLPFEIYEYQQRIEDLESEYIDQQEGADIERIFGEWKGEIQKLSDRKAEEIAEIEPTLKKAAGSAKATYFNELDRLKGKLHRAIKQEEQTQLDRIAKIKDQIFPEDTLQERVIGHIYVMNKYGLDIWDRLLQQFEDDHFTAHQLIRL